MFSILGERSGQHLFGGPAGPQTHVQNAPVNANFFSPFCNTHRLPIVCQQPNRSPVSLLLRFGCPATIRWPSVAKAFITVATRIIPIVVNAVNAVLCRRTISHISEEVGEGQPSLAHGDSSVSIIAVAGIGFTEATSQHASPCPLFRPIGLAMSSESAGLALRAAATPQGICENRFLFSALTAAKPSYFAMFANRMKLNDRPAAKGLAGQVYKAWAALGRIDRSHESTFLLDVVRTARRLQPSGCLHYSTS